MQLIDGACSLQQNEATTHTCIDTTSVTANEMKITAAKKLTTASLVVEEASLMDTATSHREHCGNCLLHGMILRSMRSQFMTSNDFNYYCAGFAHELTRVDSHASTEICF